MISREIEQSHGEKKIARRAFDLAYSREMAEITRELKNMINEITEDKDIWQIEDYLRDKRKDMSFRYDYRYSVLLTTFPILIKLGYLDEAELEGLSEEKLSRIRKATEIFSKPR